MKELIREKRAVVAGIMLVVAGLLLVIYPPLLSIIVALFLILSGILVISIARHNRRLERHFENPTIEIFFR
jgi:uncharacterized membrane protein HdeD (DUF308 family)